MDSKHLKLDETLSDEEKLVRIPDLKVHSTRNRDTTIVKVLYVIKTSKWIHGIHMIL